MTTVVEGVTLRERVAEEIRGWMGRRRMSGVELGRALDRSQSYVSRRLSGEVAFDVDELESVARVLGVPVEVLITESVPSPRTPGMRAANQQYVGRSRRPIPSRPDPTRPAGGRPPNRPRGPNPPIELDRAEVARVAA